MDFHDSVHSERLKWLGVASVDTAKLGQIAFAAQVQAHASMIMAMRPLPRSWDEVVRSNAFHPTGTML
jgi:hypothetical protein